MLAIITWAWAHYGADGDEDLMGIEECALLLNTLVTHAKQLVETGQIPSLLLGTGCRLLRRADVLAWRGRHQGPDR